MAIQNRCWAILLVVIVSLACFGNAVLAQSIAPTPPPMAASPLLSPLPLSLSPSPLGQSVAPILPPMSSPSSPSPAPLTLNVNDCITTLAGNTSECLDYVSLGSNVTVPTPGCCSGLIIVVEEAPQCLCLLVANTSASDMLPPINQTKALGLPAVCNATTPPVSECSEIVESPVSAPPSLPSSPSPAPESAPSSLQDTCLPILINDVYDCLDFVGGNATEPNESCCKGLGTVVGTAPQCLCLLLSTNPSVTGMLPPVNETKALALPTLCNVDTPPTSTCADILGSPASAPSQSQTLAPGNDLPSKASSTLSWFHHPLALLLLPLFIIVL